MPCLQPALWLHLSICPYPSSSLLECPHIRNLLLTDTHLRSPWLVSALRINHSTFSGLQLHCHNQQFSVLSSSQAFCRIQHLKFEVDYYLIIRLPDYLWGIPVTIFSVTGFNHSRGVSFLSFQSSFVHPSAPRTASSILFTFYSKALPLPLSPIPINIISAGLFTVYWEFSLPIWIF